LAITNQIDMTAADRSEADTLNALRNTGAPPNVITTAENLARQRRTLRQQQFLPAKERAELERLNADAARQLIAEAALAKAALDHERDEELKPIETQIAAERRLPEKRDTLKTHSDYLEEMALRQVREIRDLRAVVAANSNVTIAMGTNDAGVLEALLSEAFEGNHPEHVRRVGPVVKMRLDALAAAEKAANVIGGPAGHAAQRVEKQLQNWREAESEKSPAVKKQRIKDRYQNRFTDVVTSIVRAADAFGLTVYGEEFEQVRASQNAARAKLQLSPPPSL
jgi:hypothetical protein